MDSPAFMSKTSMPLSFLYMVCWLYSAINRPAFLAYLSILISPSWSTSGFLNFSLEISLGSTKCIPTSSHSSIKSATDISDIFGSVYGIFFSLPKRETTTKFD